MKVHVIEVLMYYDGPRVVVAEDGAGAQYIANHVSEDHEDDVFLVVQAGGEALERLFAGEIDLRDLQLAEGAEGWFLGEPVPGTGSKFEFALALERQSTPIEESELLVLPGVFMRCEAGTDALSAAAGRSGAAAG